MCSLRNILSTSCGAGNGSRCWGHDTEQVLVPVLTVGLRHSSFRTALQQVGVSSYPALKFFFTRPSTEREMISFRDVVWLFGKSKFLSQISILRKNILPPSAPWMVNDILFSRKKSLPCPTICIFPTFGDQQTMLCKYYTCFPLLPFLSLINLFYKCLLTPAIKSHTVYRG